MATEKDQDFATIALREGYVEQDQVDEALAMQKGQADPKPLAQILLERGYIDFPTLTKVLALQRPKTEVLKRQRRPGSAKLSLFGQIALELGFCTQADIDHCLNEQSQEGKNGSQVPLGQILIKKRKLTIQQFMEVLRVQGRGFLICNRCGTSHTVVGYQEDREFFCKRCKGLLRVPSRVDSVSVDTQLEGEDGEGRSVEPAQVLFPMDAQGRHVLGKYEILDELGRGGMGVVYRARRLAGGQVFAVKVLRISGKKPAEEQIQRFESEARLVSRIEHPNIVAIHDWGNEGGIYYYAMDLVQGRSLADALRTEAYGENEVLHLIGGVARAIGYAHGRGVVHRDLKPSNILIDEEGLPRITDFGLAVHLEDGAGEARPGSAAGTPFYMAPEQVLGEGSRIDARTDIYSLGVILYEMLTSRLPFTGSSVPEVYRNILESPVTPLRYHLSDIRPEIEALCLRALQRSPGDRFQSAEEMAEGLRKLLGETDEKSAAPAPRPSAPPPGEGGGRPAPGEGGGRPAQEDGLEEVTAEVEEGKPSATPSPSPAGPAPPSARPLFPGRWGITALAAAASIFGAAGWGLYLFDRGRGSASGDGSAIAKNHVPGAGDLSPYRRWLEGAALLTVRSDPPGARVLARRVDLTRDTQARDLGTTPLSHAVLDPGTYWIGLEEGGRLLAFLPLVVESSLADRERLLVLEVRLGLWPARVEWKR